TWRYETLREADRDRLDRHLADCEDCRAELSTLKRLVERIPVTPVELDVDLSVSIRERLDAPRRRAAPMIPGLRLAGAFASTVVLIGVIAGLSLYRSGQPEDRVAQTVSQEVPTAPDGLLASVERLIEARNYSAAYAELAEMLKRYPGPELRGAVLMSQAKLAFEELQWYPEAYRAYQTLRQHHADLFQSDPSHIAQLNMLDEARGPEGGFTSLHALDAARRSGDFNQFESLISRYPGTYVASNASVDMAVLALAELDVDANGNMELAAMEAVLARCDEPIAIAQITMEIGYILESKMDRPDRARALYERIAESDVDALALRAQSALDALARTRPESPAP
ncbi:MAG: hypothetical protein IIB38_05800, partial [Candidatus Hydrogenedentes bacterium]|nr:hypothetical protein [Candidatus Hydrogenedentota bacterium]